jgi:hypothetical protein
MPTEQETRESEKRRFFELVERLLTTTEETEARELKKELALATFGTEAN